MLEVILVQLFLLTLWIDVKMKDYARKDLREAYSTWKVQCTINWQCTSDSSRRTFEWNMLGAPSLLFVSFPSGTP